MIRKHMHKILLFIAFAIIGWMGCNAQDTKTLSVKKIKCTALPEGPAVSALLDKNQVEFHPLDVVNWKDYPYKPEVRFRIAHTGKAILLHYQVKEASVRAVAGQDNGKVWEDACVEFFLSPESDSCYYNFECNCIGKLLIQGGIVNEDRPLARPEVLGMVKRWSSLGTEPFEERIGECSWELTMVIPVSAFFKHSIDTLEGKKMKGNFYKCGDKLQTPHFISWNPIRLAHPMFHCPAFFGNLYFE